LLASLGTGDAPIITSAALVALFVIVTAPMSGHAIGSNRFSVPASESTAFRRGIVGIGIAGTEP
jgi:hypothetical protein